LRRDTAAALEEAEISDLEDRLADARQRQKSHQQRMLEAAERTAANTARRLERSRMSVREKVEFVRQNGHAEYLKLPWQAR
jgi:hypothetical protein